MAKPPKPPPTYCDRCREPRSVDDCGMCSDCVDTRLDRSIKEQRAEFYDREMNTLVIRLRTVKSRWRVQVEHSAKNTSTKVGMKSVHGTRDEAEVRFVTLVRQTYLDGGWRPVEPRWDVQLVDVQQVMLGHWAMPADGEQGDDSA